MKKYSTFSHNVSGYRRIVLLFTVLFATTAVIAFSQETNSSRDTYLKRKDSVFLVNQSIFLDAAKVKNVDLFRNLEKAMGRPLLNQYIPITNGTAFLINEGGFLITAFHVVKHVPVSNKDEYALWSFLNYIAKYIYPGLMSRKEMNAVCREYKKISTESNVYLRLKDTDKKEYLAQIIDQNEALDLALLKIELNEKKPPIPIKEEVVYDVGDQTFSIGYPLAFIMDQFLDDFKPTITNGIISALRQDVWDIQHTAAINYGNSGGPLLSGAGDLVGVNVGLIQGANNLYFAVNAKKLTGWLKQIGRFDLIKTVPEEPVTETEPEKFEKPDAAEENGGDEK